MRRYEILDTDPERDFDDITMLSTQLCNTPIALITLLDEERQWFKSKVGMTGSVTARDLAFCAHTILQAGVLVVGDAAADERFASNPLVTGDPCIRFYAGAPLITNEGHALGTLCVIDRVPRELSAEQTTALLALSRQVVAQLELRRTVRELRQTVAQLRNAQENLNWKTAFFDAQANSSIDGIVVVDSQGTTTLQNQRVVDLFKMPPAIADNRDDAAQVRWVTNMIRNPDPFAEKVAYLYSHPDETSRDEIELKDGTTLDRYSSPVVGKDGKYYGRIWTFRDISDRKRMEESLRLLNSAVLQSKEAIIITDAELDLPGPRILFVNPAFTQMTGFTAEEVIGKTPRILQGPRTDKAVLSRLRQNLERGEVFEGETINYRKDGGEFNLEWQIAPIRDATGTTTHFVAIQRDITARKQAENALRESDEKFHQLADNITDAFWIRSADMLEVHYISPGFERIWGRSVESLYANPEQWAEFILPEDRERVLGAFTALTGDAPSLDIEYRIVRPDGEIRWVRVRAFQVRDSTNSLIRHTGIVTDITERRRIENELKTAKVAAALREGAQRYSFLADTVPLIIWTARPDGSVDYFNKAWFDYTGLTVGQTTEWGWGAVLHPDDLLLCFERWTEAFTTGEAYEIEYRFKRASDGAYRWHLGRALPLRDAHGQIVQWAGTCTDIDDAKRSEETLQAANDELGLRVMERTSELHAAKEAAEAANRAKSEFLANMSHEIRTPMNGIIGMTELVLETDLGREQREYLGMAKTSAHVLLRLINDILDFSKIEAGKLELEAISFSLRESLSTVLKPLRISAEQKGLQLITDVLAEVPDNLVGDPMRLGQILINLTDNAIKFTERGDVTLRVAVESSAADEPCLHFTVIDTGIGIPEAKQALIFEAFAQVDNSTTRTYGGTGLGLAIVSELVRKMDGRIWVETELGRGTTFHFTGRFGVGRPSRLAVEGSPAVRPADSSPRSGSGLRVLLAEDNVINRALATGILERRGHSVRHAANGREALEAATDEAFDLIFMDVQMPEMDGLEATRRIRESEKGTGRHTPIVAMTAHAMVGDRERCLAVGMDDYLSKPLQKAEMTALLERVSADRGHCVSALDVSVVAMVPEIESLRHQPRNAPRQPNALPTGEARVHSLPIFTRAKLLDQLDGDDALLGRLVALLHENTPRLLDDIRSSIARRDAPDLARSAHALLSSLGAFGAGRAQRLTRELNELPQGGRTFPKLESEVDRIFSALGGLAAQAPPLHSSPVGTPISSLNKISL